MSKTITLGVHDRVIISEMDPSNKAYIGPISGTIFSMEHVLENSANPRGSHMYQVFIQCSNPEDYKKIIRGRQGWPIYCEGLGKSWISKIVDKDQFRVLPDGNTGPCGQIDFASSYDKIHAVLISLKTFTVVPIHAVNYASRRITISL